MKILVPGDLSRVKKFKKFTCDKCGCVFVAEFNEECWLSKKQRYEDCCYAECPCCNNWIYNYSEPYKYCTEDGEPID